MSLHQTVIQQLDSIRQEIQEIKTKQEEDIKKVENRMETHESRLDILEKRLENTIHVMGIQHDMQNANSDDSKQIKSESAHSSWFWQRPNS